MNYQFSRTVVRAAFMGICTLGMATMASALEWKSPPLIMAQAATCQGWHQTCLKRCQETLPGDASCPRNNCAPKLSTCRSTGCWQEGRAFGGGKVCGLAK